MTDIILGGAYRDELTGWEGRAVAITTHIGGHQEVQLCRIDPDGMYDEVWFESERLAAIYGSHIGGIATPKKPGF